MRFVMRVITTSFVVALLGLPLFILSAEAGQAGTAGTPRAGPAPAPLRASNRTPSGWNGASWSLVETHRATPRQH
ncbi:MAG TPA: hypothetical protein VG244_12580, partial [Acidimicrobiales bacterium]|jgi:hypothetical protein|nr:hypothetical protein [Acidimicrobiales bacterium]